MSYFSEFPAEVLLAVMTNDLDTIDLYLQQGKQNMLKFNLSVKKIK